jgi:hypothetical protein
VCVFYCVKGLMCIMNRISRNRASFITLEFIYIYHITSCRIGCKSLTKMLSRSQASLGVIGHGGGDYASSAYECGYDPTGDYGICLMMTSNLGLNCSASFLIVPSSLPLPLPSSSLSHFPLVSSPPSSPPSSLVVRNPLLSYIRNLLHDRFLFCS